VAMARAMAMARGVAMARGMAMAHGMAMAPVQVMRSLPGCSMGLGHRLVGSIRDAGYVEVCW